jgi:hypothetical protein
MARCLEAGEILLVVTLAVPRSSVQVTEQDGNILEIPLQVNCPITCCPRNLRDKSPRLSLSPPRSAIQPDSSWINSHYGCKFFIVKLLNFFKKKLVSRKTVGKCTPMEYACFSEEFFVIINTSLALIFLCCACQSVVAKLSALAIRHSA